MNTSHQRQKIQFQDQVENGTLSIGVMGLGYVGLPLAVAFAEAGFRVRGMDVDRRKVQQLKKGISSVLDIPSSRLSHLIRSQKLRVSSDPSFLSKVDAIIICVPTPLRKTKEPDLSYILAAINAIKKYIQNGKLVILESTTYPGTTRELILPALEEWGGKVGKDFYLAFSPERIDPGNQRFTLHNTPKVIGGITSVCTKRAKTLYEKIIHKVVTVSSTETAEMVKLLENTYRAVNIGLVNEVAMMCDRLGLDVWEVIDAASTKPFGFAPFYPGPGIGGHCIPLDPHYLAWKLKTVNFYSRFIELATSINSNMPEYVVNRLDALLNKKGKSLSRAKILIVGVAYKKDVSDTRESPAIDVMGLLMNKGSAVSYSDPYVPTLRIGKKSYFSKGISKKTLASNDCVLFMTPHGSFDMRTIIRHSRLIFDARNATKKYLAPHIEKL